MSWHLEPHDDKEHVRMLKYYSTYRRIDCQSNRYHDWLSHRADDVSDRDLRSVQCLDMCICAAVTVASPIGARMREKGPALSTSIVRCSRSRHFDTRKSSRRDYVDLLFDVRKLSYQYQEVLFSLLQRRHVHVSKSVCR